MIDILASLDAYADDLNAAPLFPVEPPDGMKHLAELPRQATFIKLMRSLAPKATVYAVPNAGKRWRVQAQKEGIRGGVFDLTVAWNHGIAFPEFKGYSAGGRPGVLSAAQIDWGNEMTRHGHSVACFFSPMRAVEWLRDLGCPVRETR